MIYIIGAAACEKDKTEVPNQEKLTGEELFKQIVLIEGNDIDKKIPEYAPIIDELNKLTPEQQEAGKIFNDYIIQQVKSTNPNYFNNLKEAVDSKQLYAIKEVISQSHDVIINALKNSKEHGQLVQAVESFINANPDKYNFNSEQDKEKLMNDLREYLSKEGVVGNPNARGLIIVAAILIYQAIAIIQVGAVALGVYAHTAYARAQTATYPARANTKSMPILTLEKIILSVSLNY